MSKKAATKTDGELSPAAAAINPEDAFDKSKQDALEEAIKQLPPEEAAVLLKSLERALIKRKIQLTGYLAAIVVWLVGMLGALVIYGTAEGFVGYVFLIPFALVGVTLWAFGKWADKYSLKKPAPKVATKG